MPSRIEHDPDVLLRPVVGKRGTGLFDDHADAAEVVGAGVSLVEVTLGMAAHADGGEVGSGFCEGVRGGDVEP